MPNYSMHCIECDSQKVIMYNAICTWDIDNQKWVYSENYDPMFQCPDCMSDSNEITEKEITQKPKTLLEVYTNKENNNA